MSKSFSRSFYNSTAWKKCREAYAIKQRFLCEDCLAKGIINPGEIVHHKIELTPENIDDPGIALSFDNLKLVCRECHAKEHGEKQTRYTILADGRVIAQD